MKRLIDYHLLGWKNRSSRKPIILRGARQVGKTYAIRQLGKSFTHFIEVNLEIDTYAQKIFAKDLDVKRVISSLSEELSTEIIPGSTLLFIDEIQHVPQAITLLRYFYEQFPQLHVIAAGSLLDIAIEKVGVPVGRISTLYMYPLSFIEFLVALNHKEWARHIISSDVISDSLHERLINEVGKYLAVGGMPASILAWKEAELTRAVKRVHAELLFDFNQDFEYYGKKHELKYLALLFSRSMYQLSRKFMFSRIGEYKKRELDPALSLLEKAGLVHKVYRTSGQSIPLGSDADIDDFKLLFLDVGLTQELLGEKGSSAWITNPLQTFGNKGELVEAYVGQELMAYSDPIRRETLFYWRRDAPSSHAEIDYLIQQDSVGCPIEVKSGVSTRLKSMHQFLDSHPQALYGMRFWTNPESIEKQLHSYPLYAILKSLYMEHEYLRHAVNKLLE